MALALIGGMSLGTVVSLFFIPLAYWYIYKGAGRRHWPRNERQWRRAQGNRMEPLSSPPGGPSVNK